MLFKKFVLFFFIFLPFFAHSIEENVFEVSISPLILRNIDSNFSHIANSLPLLIYNEVQNTQIHHYSSEEITVINSEKLTILKNESLILLSELKEKYDKYFFSKDFDIEQYRIMEEEIISQKLLYESMDLKDIDSNTLLSTVKYNIVENGSNNTDYNEAKSIDMNIQGEIEKLDNWIYIQFWEENKILKTKKLIFKSVSSTDNLINLIPEISTKIKTSILGRSWSSLLFALEPNDTRILVRNASNNQFTEDYENLYPGKYDIELSKPGYLSKKMSVEIDAFEILKIETALEPEDSTVISFQSFPAGADLYSGSTWIGKTPLLIKSPAIPSLLTLKNEGYNDSKYVYNESSIRDIQIFMESSLIDHESIIQKKRNNFYKSFSYFLLSIPVSMISFGISSDYAYAYEREAFLSSETERLQQLSNTWYNVYLGGMFINITLFVNTLFDLVDYIKSNDFL